MAWPVPGRWLRAWSGALLALLGLACLAPGEARAASCEHRGVPSGISAGDAAEFGRLARAGALPTPDGGPTSPGRCSGATCSEHPSSPLAPKPLAPPRSEGWGTTSRPIVIAEPPAAPHPGPDEAVRPIHSATSIFHPPRPLLPRNQA